MAKGQSDMDGLNAAIEKQDVLIDVLALVDEMQEGIPVSSGHPKQCIVAVVSNESAVLVVLSAVHGFSNVVLPVSTPRNVPVASWNPVSRVNPDECHNFFYRVRRGD